MCAVVDHVYLRPNNLPDAWTGKPVWVVGELGFGTGLNFFQLADLWRKSSRPNQRLYFLSCERAPFRRKAFQSLWAAPPRHLRAIIQQFILRFPLVTPGFHRIEMPDYRIVLDLYFGEVESWLRELHATVDSWLLDGFTPARNPEMWSKQVLSFVRKRSRNGTTFATYTSAGEVRRTLSDVGFCVERIPGFPPKRDSLRGTLRTGVDMQRRSAGKVAIIGGGLAGTAAARSLSSRGVGVTLFEREATLATRASGNSEGVVYPYLAREMTPTAELYLQAFNYFLQRVIRSKAYDLSPEVFRQTEALHFLSSIRLQGIYEGLPDEQIDSDLVSLAPLEIQHEITRLHLPSAFLWHPTAGVVMPAALCHARLKASNAEVRCLFQAEVLDFLESENGVEVRTSSDSRHSEHFDTIVVASAYEASSFPQFSFLPIEPVRGQTARVTFAGMLGELRRALCYDGYVAPSADGHYMIGATYEHGDDRVDVRPSDQNLILERFLRLLPPETSPVDHVHSERVCIRTSTFDRVPILGGTSAFGAGRVHLFLGLGSRGAMSSELLGETLACQLTQEPLPVSRSLAKNLDLARYNVHCERQGTDPGEPYVPSWRRASSR